MVQALEVMETSLIAKGNFQGCSHHSDRVTACSALLQTEGHTEACPKVQEVGAITYPLHLVKSVLLGKSLNLFKLHL